MPTRSPEWPSSCPTPGPSVDPKFDPFGGPIPGLGRNGTVGRLDIEVPRDNEAARLAERSDPLHMLNFFVQSDCARCHIYTEGVKSPGDYHSSGCSACHVYYKSDGFSETADATIPKDETDHAFKHEMQRYPSNEQCAHCHNRGSRHSLEVMGLRERPQGFKDLLVNDHQQNTRTKQADSGRQGGFFPWQRRLLIDR